MSVALYVYYRLDGNFLSFEQSSRKLMQQIASKTQTKGRLLQRRDDRHTWMEIYEPVTDLAALEQALATAVAADPCWQGITRHTECFVEI